jgi:hypothetical protein
MSILVNKVQPFYILGWVWVSEELYGGNLFLHAHLFQIAAIL